MLGARMMGDGDGGALAASLNPTSTPQPAHPFPPHPCPPIGQVRKYLRAQEVRQCKSLTAAINLVSTQV